ncbi:MAG: surface antigen family protein [Candidatus Xenolissoclinum pacificiensis L6]|uniref:Surface antigen family protein n=1 Tax=Candidatus Xenolissoclinum pacificiensis L6 TaxID=1401685 RepID=W2UYL9_9RICK|nr:MAG: surface antigen family protein [Candidatus Xenolissoclinum pacificiensis L6]
MKFFPKTIVALCLSTYSLLPMNVFSAEFTISPDDWKESMMFTSISYTPSYVYAPDSGVNVSPSYNLSSRVDYDLGHSFAMSIGYQSKNNYILELKFAQKYIGIDTDSTEIYFMNDRESYKLQINDIIVNQYILNAKYIVSTLGSFSPILGAGIGFSKTATLNQILNSFMLSGSLGLEYTITHNLRIFSSLTFDYPMDMTFQNVNNISNVTLPNSSIVVPISLDIEIPTTSVGLELGMKILF